MSIEERLEKCYTGAVYDVLREMGRTRCVLPTSIRPLEPSMVIAGPVFTVRGRPDDTVSAHESLLRWTEFLSKAPAAHVVVCQPQDDTRALMGELSAETLHARGVKGYIVDGGSRDSKFILRLGFPVFCRFRSPRDVVGAWVPEAFSEPIRIGDVTITDRDYVVADIDGVVIIPGDIAEQVVGRVDEVMQTENLVRKAILDGVDPQQAYLKYGKF